MAAFPAMGLGQAVQRVPPAYPRYPPCIDRSVRRPACLSSAPRPSDRPEGRPVFRGRHRGPGPAFKGLSYVGIRASIRRLLPRRLEPILSWVFTPLGFSPFLPRPRRLRGLLSRTWTRRAPKRPSRLCHRVSMSRKIGLPLSRLPTLPRSLSSSPPCRKDRFSLPALFGRRFHTRECFDAFRVGRVPGFDPGRSPGDSKCRTR
jgi:hypothetical protein